MTSEADRRTSAEDGEPDVLERFVDALPKVELHLHLEGSVRPETLLLLAARHGSSALPRDLDGLRAFYTFRDFAHFADVYYAICDTLRTAEDFALIVRELGATLASQRVRYAEVTFTPFNHIRRGIPAEAVFEGVEQGRLEAEAAHDLQLRWCTDVPGELGADAGTTTASAVLRSREAGRLDGAVSFGLGGPEVGVRRRDFADAFAMARGAGLHSVPHAGETGGADSIWEALTYLNAERIGHGVRCLDDPKLVAHLRQQRIPLEVCPTSNVRTGVVAGYADHPLRRLLDQGLVIVLGSDDPPMFNTTLRAEHLLVVRELGLSPAELAGLVEAGVQAAFLPADEQQELLAAVREVQLPA